MAADVEVENSLNIPPHLTGGVSKVNLSTAVFMCTGQELRFMSTVHMSKTVYLTHSQTLPNTHTVATSTVLAFIPGSYINSGWLDGVHTLLHIWTQIQTLTPFEL